jgi:hypothetical protein
VVGVGSNRDSAHIVIAIANLLAHEKKWKSDYFADWQLASIESKLKGG